MHELLVLVSELAVNFLARSPAEATDFEKSLKIFQRELVREVSVFALERQHYLANGMLVGCHAERDQVLRKVLKDDISSQRFVPDFENFLSNRRLVHAFYRVKALVSLFDPVFHLSHVEELHVGAKVERFRVLLVYLANDICNFLGHDWIHGSGGDLLTGRSNLDLAIHGLLELLMLIQHSADQSNILNESGLIDFLYWGRVVS